VWVVPQGSFSLEPLAPRLIDFGFHVTPSGSASSGNVPADLRVLPTDSFEDLHQLRAEYGCDARPTMILASSPEQALAACDFVNDHDEIAQRAEPLPLLARRLALLARRHGLHELEVARREANEDPVTGLNNRRYFEARIGREIEITRRQRRALTIALMDLDDFRRINERFRWPTGDRALRYFADTARANVRLVDWLARYGGEEFCLAMPDTNLQTGCMVADRVRAQVAAGQIESLDHGPVKVAVSIGVAQFTDDVEDAVALVDKAAKALKEAKGAGKNRTVAARDGGDTDTAFCEIV